MTGPHRTRYGPPRSLKLHYPPLKSKHRQKGGVLLLSLLVHRLLAAVAAKLLIFELPLDKFLILARPVVRVLADTAVELQ